MGGLRICAGPRPDGNGAKALRVPAHDASGRGYIAFPAPVREERVQRVTSVPIIVPMSGFAREQWRPQGPDRRASPVIFAPICRCAIQLRVGRRKILLVTVADELPIEDGA